MKQTGFLAYASGATVGAAALVWAGHAPAEIERGQPYQLSTAVVSSGAAVVDNGSLAVVGQPVVGVTGNAQFTMHVGAVPVLLAAANPPLPGDADNDGDLDHEDYTVLYNCLGGPDGTPSPTPLTTPEQCLAVFDFDDDGDVDLEDWSGFSKAFTDPVP